MSFRDDLHNELNPDMRSFGSKGTSSFGSKGTSSINPHDEAEMQRAEEEADARDSVDEETEASAHGYDREAEFDCDEEED